MKGLASVVALLLFAVAASASSLYIGNDTSGPVTVYDSSGTFIENFGQSGATGTGINWAGGVWTVAPYFGDNHIVEYTPGQTVINTFVATVNGEWIEDMSHGVGNTLWASTFEGDVFAINDQTGAILSMFSVANSSYTGIAYDSKNGFLYVSGGLTSDNIFVYSTSGALLNTISLNATCGGVAYDISSDTLWCGDFGKVWHYSLTGQLLGSYTTTAGNYHDGLETPNFGTTTTTPEPASLSMLGAGLLGVGGFARKRMKKA